MFRPATPLSVLLFIAFAFLLISVLSAPIVRGIPIGSFKGVNFGVFGFCRPASCSTAAVGYNPGDTSDARFSLSLSARKTLTYILIVHPIAALFALVLLLLSVTAHVRAAAHSPRYMLVLFLLLLPTFLLSLLSFLVDILLFSPHLSWAGWLVLAATIVLAVAAVVACGMRRALVNRRAHHKRIAANAEMNGDAFHHHQTMLPPPSPLGPEPSRPSFTPPGNADKLPEFATFDTARTHQVPLPLDERIPLNASSSSARFRPDGSIGGRAAGGSSDAGSVAGIDPRLAMAPNRIGDPYPEQSPPSPVRAGSTPGWYRDGSDPRLRDRQPDGVYGPPMHGTPPPSAGRGRAGYGPPPRGSYGRGGYPGPYRGPMGPGPAMDGRGPMGPGPGVGPGMGASMGRGALYGGPPDPGRTGYGPGMAVPGGRGPPYARDQSLAGGYPARRPSPGPPSASYRPQIPPDALAYPSYGPGPPSPEAMPAADLPLNASMLPPMPHAAYEGPMPVGQAIEMDANTGRPSPSHTPMPAMLVGRRSGPGSADGRPSRAMAMGPPDAYRRMDAYVPARAGWAPDAPADPSTAIGPDANITPTTLMPVELPTPHPGAGRGPDRSPTHVRVGSGDSDYYEDVDPRFMDNEPRSAPAPLPTSLQVASHPHAIAPPMPLPTHAVRDGDHEPEHATMAISRSYEDMHDIAHSDASHFTSISQRAVNPHWQPAPPPVPVPRRTQDVLLMGNNDFELPSAGRPRTHQPGPTSAPMMGPRPGASRYPTANDA
ncbi:MAG: regulator of ime2 [Phylliscum demangeonii]|nr:MAG: regulator of ime2 [Phylliscum demangeonii]